MSCRNYCGFVVIYIHGAGRNSVRVQLVLIPAVPVPATRYIAIRYTVPVPVPVPYTAVCIYGTSMRSAVSIYIFFISCLLCCDCPTGSRSTCHGPSSLAPQRHTNPFPWRPVGRRLPRRGRQRPPCPTPSVLRALKNNCTISMRCSLSATCRCPHIHRGLQCPPRRRPSPRCHRHRRRRRHFFLLGYPYPQPPSLPCSPFYSSCSWSLCSATIGRGRGAFTSPGRLVPRAHASRASCPCRRRWRTRTTVASPVSLRPRKT